MSEICWRSGVPIEGEQAPISEHIVDRVPRSEQVYSVAVMQCCGAAVGKGKEVRGRGERGE